MEALQPVTAPDRPPVQGRLILITLLAIFPFLTLLVMEQNRVIEAQRNLIRQLVGDSMELNSIKAHAAKSNGGTQISPAAPATTAPAPPAPATPTPRSQEPSSNPAIKPQKPSHNADAPEPPKAQPRRVIDMTHLKAA